MTLCICKCLNLTLESDKMEDNVDIEKLELTTTEQRDIFFSEKLLSCPISTLKTQVAQQALFGQRVINRWTVYFCLACGLSTHAILHDRSNGPSIVLIAKSTLTTSDQINAMRNSSNFSPVFNLLVPGVATDVEMKENIDTNNRTMSNKNAWPTQPMIGSLNMQLRQTLESQLESKLEAVEDSVRQFKDKKYAEYEAYRERAHRDHKILASIIVKNRENNDNDGLRIDTSLDNGPPSPLLPPQQRRRLSSIKDAKKIPQSHVIKRNRNFSHEEDSLDADVLFDLEGMDSHNSAISDQDDYDSDDGSNDEGIQVSRPRGPHAVPDIAHSVPITVPNFDKERYSRREMDDDEVSQDIAASIKALAQSVHGDMFELPPKRCSTQIYASRVGTEAKPRTALVVDEEDELYSGFNDVAPALDTRNLREDHAFQEALKTAGIGRKVPSRMGTGMFRVGTVSVRGASSRAGTAAARPVTAVRAAGYTSSARDTPSRDDRKEDSIEDKVKQMEARIMTLVEESCMLSARLDSEDDSATKRELDMGQALAKAQEASTLERQLIRMQEQANLGDTHNLDLTFAVLCNLAGQYALNEMYTEALNTYQLLTRNKLFPHANRLKVNMGNIYFKMGEHPKALKLYRMALDQTPTAEKDLRMKVMHNIGLLLVRMGKFRDAVTNFQHIMHEQGDFQTGLHLVLCSVALSDAEGGKAAFHAMLDVDPPSYHQDITIDDENDAYECVLRDVLRGDRLSRWSRRAAADAERCLALAAAALVRPASRDDDSGGMSWCVEALRGYSGGGAGARLELGGALAALRAGRAAAAQRAGVKALTRLKAVARAHPTDRVLRAEANADAAFVAYALGKYSEARSLSEAASRDDPYACAARVSLALAAAREAEGAAGVGAGAGEGWAAAAPALAAAAHLDPADLIAMHDAALALEKSGSEENAAAAEARWTRMRSAAGAGACARSLAAAALARLARSRADDPAAADHWYSMIGGWDVGVTCALAQLHSEMGDSNTAKHHYQDVEAVWPCEVSALEWLATESTPDTALGYYRRAARLQPNNPRWGLLMGGCLRAAGRYQEALAVYKKMNARFPDNVQCLKLIVKLCGDQGLSETSAWARELQRAQGRLKQQERVSVTSAGSGSSGASQSPIDQLRAGSRGGSGRVDSSLTRVTTYSNDAVIQDSIQPASRSVRRSASRKKNMDEFDGDLPLPPE